MPTNTNNEELLVNKDIESLINQVKYHTTDSMVKFQSIKTPYFLDIQPKICKSYRYNGMLHASVDNYIYLINGINFKPYKINHKSDMKFILSMRQAYDMGKIMPFLLFINNRFVKWSKITIVRDYKYIYLLIDKHIFDEEMDIKNTRDITSFDILNLPFDITYNENNIPNHQHQQLFRFDNRGEILDWGKTVFYIKDKSIDVKKYTYLTGKFNNEDLGFPSTVKITPKNMICFKDGKLFKYPNINISNLNMMTANNKEDAQYTYFLVRGVDANDDWENVTVPNNDDLLKDIAIGNIKIPDLDIDTLNKTLDINLTTDRPYQINIRNAMTNICKHNMRFLVDVYAKHSIVSSQTYTGLELKNKVDLTNHITMLRRMSDKGKGKDTYVMIFHNGFLYERHDSIEYGCNTFRFHLVPEEVDDRDWFEFIYIKNVNNFAIPVVEEEINQYLGGPIDGDNLLLFTAHPHEELLPNFQPTDRTLFPVDFTIENGMVHITDEYYKGQLLYCVAKNQFRYCKRYIQGEDFRIRLTQDFTGCMNPNQYLIFINGKLMHKQFYRVLLENVKLPFAEPWLYSKIPFHKGDRVEVIYFPIEFDYVKYGGGVTLDAINVELSSNEQKIIKIPYPNAEAKNKNNFIVLANGTFIDPARYVINSDAETIDFTNDSRFTPFNNQYITFLFGYKTTKKQNPIQYVTENSHILFDKKYVEIQEYNLSNKTFKIPEPYEGYVRMMGNIIVCYRGTLINPSRYKIINTSESIQFTDNTINLEVGQYLEFIFAHSPNERILQQYVNIPITEHNQSIIDVSELIDKNYLKEDNFFITVNSTLLHTGLYRLNFETKELYLNKIFPVGTIITFNIYYNTPNIYFDMIDIVATKDNQTQFSLDKVVLSKYVECESKTILAINSLIVPNIDYKINPVTGIEILNKQIHISKGTALSLVVAFYYNDSQNQYAFANSTYLNMYHSSIPFDKSKYIYSIPFPEAAENMCFIVTVGSLLLSRDRYTISNDTNTIEINHNDQLYTETTLPDVKRDLTFYFIGDDKTLLTQEDIKIHITKENRDNTIYNFESPRPNYFALGGQFQLFIGASYVNQITYTIEEEKNTTHCKIVFKQPYSTLNVKPTGDETTVSKLENAENSNVFYDMVLKFFYVKNNECTHFLDEEASMISITKEGYLDFNKDDLKVPVSKKLGFLFMNGRKISYDDIEDINSSLLKIKRDPQSRFNMMLLNFTPANKYLDEYFRIYSQYDYITNNLKGSTIDRLYRFYNYISNTAPKLLPEMQEFNLITAIVRDWYNATNIYRGQPFPYAYETQALLYGKPKYDYFNTRYNDGDKTKLNGSNEYLESIGHTDGHTIFIESLNAQNLSSVKDEQPTNIPAPDGPVNIVTDPYIPNDPNAIYLRDKYSQDIKTKNTDMPKYTDSDTISDKYFTPYQVGDGTPYYPDHNQ